MARAKKNYKDEYYRITKMMSGVRKEFYGKTKREAEYKRDEYIKMLESGLDPALTQKTLKNAMETWFETFVINEVKKSSYDRYRGIFDNYISKDIGNLIVGDIKSFNIQTYYNQLAKTKSWSQIHSVHKLLTKFFGYALDDGYIIRNPCRKVKNPAPKKETEVEIFTTKEIQRMISIKSRHSCMIKTMLYTGIRLGECIALTWDDINFDTQVITINKSVNNQGILSTTKTKSSYRYLVFPKGLGEDLKTKRLENKVEKLAAGYEDKGLVFPSEYGTHISQSNFRKAFKKVLDQAGVTYRKPHTLRHTFTTNGRRLGYAIDDIARMLGHSTIKTTQDSYMHYDTNDLREMVNKMYG